MATIRIQSSAANQRNFQESPSAAYYFNPNINAYGYQVIESYFQYRNNLTAYYTFNLAQVLTQQITKVTLENQRTSFNNSNGTSSTGTVETNVSFYDVNANLETTSPTQFNPNPITESGSSGTIRRDITAWFLANYKSRIYGTKVGFARHGGNKHITDTLYTHLELETSSLPSYPPANLIPDGGRNPRSPIQFIWVFARNPGWASEDPQTAWELTIWQDGETPIVITEYNLLNTYTLPANTFSGTGTVNFKVRTQTQYNGWGSYTQSSFTLGASAPFAPILLFPLNIAIPGTNAIPLQWSYNSPYDTRASKFDIRYRFQLTGDSWTEWVQFSNTGQLTAELPQTLTQENVQWQVKAYGLLGDVGPWSDVGGFQIRGVPKAPVIVDVSNSNRPTVYFSITQGIAYELQILQDGNILYDTDFLPFEGVFSYQTSVLLPNSNYLVRMRVTVGDGLESTWSVRPFVINTVAPQALKLEVSNTLNFSTTLYFDNPNNQVVYVYRDGLRIAKATESIYNDYTSQPKKRHIYSIRNVTQDWAFADSNQVVNMPTFLHSTIATTNNPEDMVKLIYMIDGQPTKDMSYGYETIFTNYLGRDKQVVEVGDMETKALSLAFYVGLDEADKLMEFVRHPGGLILRDWRLGVVYGQIDGEISFTPSGKKTIASFSFREADFPIEVEL